MKKAIRLFRKNLPTIMAVSAIAMIVGGVVYIALDVPKSR